MKAWARTEMLAALTVAGALALWVLGTLLGGDIGPILYGAALLGIGSAILVVIVRLLRWVGDLRAQLRVVASELRTVRSELGGGRVSQILPALQGLDGRMTGMLQTQQRADRMIKHGFLTRDQYRPATTHENRVMFVSSNGAGLGHLTRLWAIERKTTGQKITYTLSAAFAALGRREDEIIHFPSAETTGLHPAQWNRSISQHFSAAVAAFGPDVVVFDGTYVYPGITDTCRASGARLIWLQRGCWKKDVDRTSLQRHNAVEHCDLVILPGDYGCEEEVNLGSGIQSRRVNPIILTEPADVLPAAAAREALGLPPDKLCVLIQLGAGIVGSAVDARRVAVETVLGLGEPWCPVLVRNPLARTTEDYAGVPFVSGYPLAPYYSAFEFVVVAAGYNSVQECIGLQIPSVFVPNPDTVTDDQVRRALTCSNAGLGRVALDSAQLVESIEALAEADERARMRQRMREVPPAGGASEAARIIEDEVRLSRMLRPTIRFGPSRESLG